LRYKPLLHYIDIQYKFLTSLSEYLFIFYFINNTSGK